MLQTKSLILCLFSLLILQTALIAQENDEKGSISSSLNLAEIPNQVVKVTGTLSKVGIPTIWFAFDIKDNTAMAKLNNLPKGHWRLEVKAYDKNHVLLFEGSQKVNVAPSSVTAAEIHLKPTTGSLKVSASWQENSGGLIAYYPLDGNVEDVSGNNLNGQSNSVNPIADRHGNEEGALSFGSGREVRLENFPSFNGLKQFTLSCWVYPTSYGRYNFIFSKVSPNRDIVLSIYKNKVDAHFAHWSTYYSCRGKQDIPLKAWTHLAIVWDGSSWFIYVNGNLDSQADHPGAAPKWTGNSVFIGSLQGYYDFSGRIDDLCLFGRALNAREIAKLSR